MHAKSLGTAAEYLIFYAQLSFAETGGVSSAVCAGVIAQRFVGPKTLMTKPKCATCCISAVHMARAND